MVVLLVGVFYLLGRKTPDLNLGIVVVPGLYIFVTHILVLVAAFRTSTGKGLLTLFIPFYVFYFVYKVNNNATLKILYGFSILFLVGISVLLAAGVAALVKDLTSIH